MPVYLVVASDLDKKNVIFKRVVYSKSKNEAVPIALFEENKDRSFENRLIRSKMYYSVQTLICFVPELDDPRLVVEYDHGNDIKVEQEQGPDIQ